MVARQAQLPLVLWMFCSRNYELLRQQPKTKEIEDGGLGSKISIKCVLPPARIFLRLARMSRRTACSARRELMAQSRRQRVPHLKARILLIVQLRCSKV
jgi:hypothetical protein